MCPVQNLYFAVLPLLVYLEAMNVNAATLPAVLIGQQLTSLWPEQTFQLRTCHRRNAKLNHKLLNFTVEYWMR